MRTAKKQASSAMDMVIGLIKAALLAAVVTLALVLLYAYALQQGWLPDTSIPLVNAVIKVLGAALAALVVTRKCQARRWLLGAGAGVAYILLAFVVFSIAADHFNFGAALAADVGMGAVAGLLAGMLMGLRR